MTKELEDRPQQAIQLVEGTEKTTIHSMLEVRFKQCLYLVPQLPKGCGEEMKKICEESDNMVAGRIRPDDAKHYPGFVAHAPVDSAMRHVVHGARKLITNASEPAEEERGARKLIEAEVLNLTKELEAAESYLRLLDGNADRERETVRGKIVYEED